MPGPRELVDIQQLQPTDNLSYGKISINDTATQIVTSNDYRCRILIKNRGSNVVFLGDSSVTVDTGYPLEPGEEIDVTGYTGAIYGICDSGESSIVRYWEEG